MDSKEKHNNLLMDNRLRRIENRLRKIEILFLKNLKTDKSIKKEIASLEKEEVLVEKEQKKLEREEKDIIQAMKHMEKEEKWSVEVRYNCKLKIMDDLNVIKCEKTHKMCDMTICPVSKK